jgi:hypothetical protein
MQRGATDVEIFGQLMNFELTFRTACDMLPTLDYMRRDVLLFAGASSCDPDSLLLSTIGFSTSTAPSSKLKLLIHVAQV